MSEYQEYLSVTDCNKRLVEVAALLINCVDLSINSSLATDRVVPEIPLHIDQGLCFSAPSSVALPCLVFPQCVCVCVCLSGSQQGFLVFNDAVVTKEVMIKLYLAAGRCFIYQISSEFLQKET